MKVLVLGSGGREHAICWKLRQSEELDALYNIPGNPGIAQVAQCKNIDPEDLSAVVNFVKENKIDFTIVGPELYLSLGIVDLFKKEGLKIFGPSKAAAELESSKVFAKDVMQAAGVPTAGFKSFRSLEELLNEIQSSSAPLVLKADGLAAGKGVFVCQTHDDAISAAQKLFIDFKAEEVLLEECMFGKEASFIVATDGQRIVPLASSHDYKRIFDGDEGPNTGGMGTVSPTPRMSKEQEDWTIENVIKPVLEEMNKRSIPYQGFLYAGLMFTEEGIKVVEFNARLGDPETQVIMRRLDSDLLSLLYALSEKKDLPEVSWTAASAVCVVLASGGYPESSSKGDVITGINLAEQQNNAVVFHAGTGFKDDNFVTAGGRVLNITSLGEDLDSAINNTYKAADLVQFAGRQCRRDIGRL